MTRAEPVGAPAHPQEETAEWRSSPLAPSPWESRPQVKDAPRMDTDASLSPEEEDALYRHYGLSRGGDATTATTTGTSTAGTSTAGTDQRTADASAAAEPPEEPPGVRVTSHGLWQGP